MSLTTTETGIRQLEEPQGHGAQSTPKFYVWAVDSMGVTHVLPQQSHGYTDREYCEMLVEVVGYLFSRMEIIEQ